MPLSKLNRLLGLAPALLFTFGVLVPDIAKAQGPMDPLAANTTLDAVICLDGSTSLNMSDWQLQLDGTVYALGQIYGTFNGAPPPTYLGDPAANDGRARITVVVFPLQCSAPLEPRTTSVSGIPDGLNQVLLDSPQDFENLITTIEGVPKPVPPALGTCWTPTAGCMDLALDSICPGGTCPDDDVRRVVTVTTDGNPTVPDDNQAPIDTLTAAQLSESGGVDTLSVIAVGSTINLQHPVDWVFPDNPLVFDQRTPSCAGAGDVPTEDIDLNPVTCTAALPVAGDEGFVTVIDDFTDYVPAMEAVLAASLPTDTDGDGNPDITDPDDDNDGIGDVYDRKPLDDSNAICTTNNGTNATLVGATISAQQRTCAAKESVVVSGNTNVGVDGDLRLISEKVSLTDTSVTGNGRIEVINADPCPGCVFPPAFFQFGVPVADYQALFNQLVANGFRPVWLDGYRSGGQSFINAIFDKTQVASWASAHGQNGADFQAFLNDQTLAGRTLVHVDSYRQGNDIVYASIFVDQPGPPWIAYSGLTDAQHQAQFNNLLGLGYRASIISVVEDSDGVARYTGLYDQSNVGGWVALTNLTSAQYNAEFVNQANAGRALAYLNGYTINGSPRFTAIWNSNVPNSWVSVHDRTSAQFQSDFDLWTGQGLLTRLVTGYDNGGTANFAGLWTD